MPFRAKRDCSVLVDHTGTLVEKSLAISLSPPISNGLSFHQTPEDAAEAAGTGITEAQSDIGDRLVGFHEQMTGRIKSNFRNDAAVTCSHFTEMPLKRTRAHSQLICRPLKRGSTVPKRSGNSRPHCILRRHTDRFHGHVVKDQKALPPRLIVVFVDSAGPLQRSGHKPPKFLPDGGYSDANAGWISVPHCSKRAVGWTSDVAAASRRAPCQRQTSKTKPLLQPGRGNHERNSPNTLPIRDSVCRHS